MDLVVTVCDNAAGETCPVWPGRPAGAHSGIPDPAAVGGSDAQQRATFRAAYDALEARIRAFLALPLATLTPAALRRELDRIGNLPA